MDVKLKVKEKLELGKIVTFLPNLKYPIYRWFHYKEGFSRDFLEFVFKKFEIKTGLVLDPFCGVGTTLLYCKEKGIDSIGFDVFALPLFVAKVKLEEYNKEKVKEIAKILFKQKFEKVKIEVPGYIKRYFNKHILEDIFFFKEKIKEIEEDKYRKFFLLALMNASLKCSYAYKDGSVIKVKKKAVPPLRKMFFRVVNKMILDIGKLEFKDCKVVLEKKDARFFELSGGVNYIITSPPYLNKVEYSKIYSIESTLFLEEETETSLRSYIGEARAYFDDLRKVLKNLRKVCEDNAKLTFVLGDGVEDFEIVNVLEKFCELAENEGFIAEEILIVNKRVATLPSRRKIGILREGIIFLSK